MAASSGCRSMSGTRMSQLGTGTGSGTGVGGCRNRSYRFRSPGAPLDRVQALSRHPAEPRLTIIDFNQLTRGGLELATSKNRAKVTRKAAKSKRWRASPLRRVFILSFVVRLFGINLWNSPIRHSEFALCRGEEKGRVVSIKNSSSKLYDNAWLAAALKNLSFD